MIKQRGLLAKDRPALVALLAELSAFSEDERAVALELADATLARPDDDDYRFILSFDDGDGGGPERLAGYICYGRTPMTLASYDLYWIATSPNFARSGIARGLVASMEEAITEAGGGIIRVETGSREGYEAASHFYDALGFARACQIEDFYAPGDDLLIFAKRISGSRATPFDEMDEPALFDLAFGYREYPAERDFLLDCARRFGTRDVKRVLAWACGPARHLVAFADQGIAGVGADGDKAMIAYARRMVGTRAQTSPGITFVKADLHQRPDTAPVDLSFVALSSIHYLTSPKELEKHLRHASTLLLPGGVHVIEATHPEDLTPSGVHHTEWSEVRGDTVVDARFRMHVDRLTADRKVPVTLEVLCSVKKNGGSGNGSNAVKPSLKQEDTWYIPDLDGWRSTIAKVPELELVATLGDFNVDVPFDHEQAWRLILVLRRAS